MAFTFPAMAAWDPVSKASVPNTVFQVYATTDTGFTSPLAITDTFGATLANLNSGSAAIFPQFKQAVNATVVVSDTAHVYAWTVIAIQPPTQDANVAGFVNDKTSSTASGLRTNFAGIWQAGTVYAAGQAVIAPTGDVVTSISSQTSGGTYSSTLWNNSATFAPMNLTGTYAARPAATTVRTGVIYYATNTLEAYRATGTAGALATSWTVIASGGTELAYAESTTTFSLTSPSNSVGTDIPSLSITFTPGERPTKLEFGALLNIKASPGEAVIRITTSTGTSVKEGHFVSPNTAFFVECEMQIRKPLTAGTSVTYKIQGLGGSTVVPYDIVGAATWPMWIRASSL